MAVSINGTTGIASVDASVAAPSVRGTDGNTGISYGADSIKFSTGGVERMAISNSGVTGISAGKILEVVSAVSTTTLNTTTVETDHDTNLSGSITTTGSNKVFVLINQNIVGRRTTTGSFAVAWKLARSTDGGAYSEIYNSGDDNTLEFRASGVSVYNVCRWNACLNFLDSPGAGAHTYKTIVYMTGGEVTVKAQEDGHPSTITMMEVEA